MSSVPCPLPRPVQWINRLSSSPYRIARALRGSSSSYDIPRVELAFPPISHSPPGMSCLLPPQNLGATLNPSLQLTTSHQTLPQFQKACSSARGHSNLRLLWFSLGGGWRKINPPRLNKGSRAPQGCPQHGWFILDWGSTGHSYFHDEGSHKGSDDGGKPNTWLQIPRTWSSAK